MARPRSTPTRPADWDIVVRSLLFWSFVGVSLLLFAACILLPEWRETRVLAAQRDAMAGRAEALSRRVSDQQRVTEGVRTSPVVLERLLESELRYRRPDEVEVIVKPPIRPVLAEGQREPESTPAAVPLLPAWLAARVGEGPWVNVFYASPDRDVCLVLSAVLLVSAFWLFPPRSPRATAMR